MLLVSRGAGTVEQADIAGAHGRATFGAAEPDVADLAAAAMATLDRRSGAGIGIGIGIGIGPTVDYVRGWKPGKDEQRYVAM